MESSENKKSNIGLIIIIIILILLLLFAVWFFLLRDKGTTSNSNINSNTIEEKSNKNEETKKNNSTYEYDYRDGVLTQVVDEKGNPKQTDFIIDGIILIGNRHGYFDTDDTDTILNNFVQQGYKKEGINSSFYLNEHIEMYLDTKYNGESSNIKVLITPHKKIEEYENMSISELTTLAEEKGTVLDYQTPDQENNKYIGDPYVNADYQEGKYDILFTYKGKIVYFININLVKEPTE